MRPSWPLHSRPVNAPTEKPCIDDVGPGIDGQGIRSTILRQIGTAHLPAGAAVDRFEDTSALCAQVNRVRPARVDKQPETLQSTDPISNRGPAISSIHSLENTRLVGRRIENIGTSRINDKVPYVNILNSRGCSKPATSTIGAFIDSILPGRRIED